MIVNWPSMKKSCFACTSLKLAFIKSTYIMTQLKCFRQSKWLDLKLMTKLQVYHSVNTDEVINTSTVCDFRNERMINRPKNLTSPSRVFNIEDFKLLPTSTVYPSKMFGVYFSYVTNLNGQKHVVE